MKLFRTLLVGALIALTVASFGSAVIWAQTVIQNQISGNECWTAAQGPGGQGQWICLGLVRNGRDMNVLSGSGAQTLLMTQNSSTVFWTGTAPTTLTVTTPVTAFDGQILIIATDTTLTTMVTLTANTGQTLNASYTSQTLSANTSVEWQFDLGTAKWFKIR